MVMRILGAPLWIVQTAQVSGTSVVKAAKITYHKTATGKTDDGQITNQPYFNSTSSATGSNQEMFTENSTIISCSNEIIPSQGYSYGIKAIILQYFIYPMSKTKTSEKIMLLGYLH